jgi:hypothetical protein
MFVTSQPRDIWYTILTQDVVLLDSILGWLFHYRHQKLNPLLLVIVEY